MGRWKEELNLNAILGSSKLPDSAPVPPALKAAIREELGKSEYLPVNNLIESLNECESVRDLDRWLDGLYDAADRLMVWLGP